MCLVPGVLPCLVARRRRHTVGAGATRAVVRLRPLGHASFLISPVGPCAISRATLECAHPRIVGRKGPPPIGRPRPKIPTGNRSPRWVDISPGPGVGGPPSVRGIPPFECPQVWRPDWKPFEGRSPRRWAPSALPNAIRGVISHRARSDFSVPRPEIRDPQAVARDVRHRQGCEILRGQPAQPSLP